MTSAHILLWPGLPLRLGGDVARDRERRHDWAVSRATAVSIAL
jgi:hypothetical protein